MSESKQARVLELIADGWSVLEVAFSLRISPQAVYQHLAAAGVPAPSKRGGRD